MLQQERTNHTLIASNVDDTADVEGGAMEASVVEDFGVTPKSGEEWIDHYQSSSLVEGNDALVIEKAAFMMT